MYGKFDWATLKEASSVRFDDNSDRLPAKLEADPRKCDFGLSIKFLHCSFVID